jgi:uncharacterized protein DUF1579
MKHTLAAVAALALCVVTVTAAQAPPKPGPEHQKLAPFVGNWTFSGEMKPGVMGPGGKMTGNDRVTWMPGGFFVERRVQGKVEGGGDMQGVEILGYDAGKKVHTYHFFDNMGTVGTGTMTLTGSTWNVTGTASSGGQTMQERCALTFGAGNSTLNVKCEVSMDGKSWAPFIEGTATKGK